VRFAYPSQSQQALGLFFEQARQGQGMDAELPMRHRDVTSAALAKCSEKASSRGATPTATATAAQVSTVLTNNEYRSQVLIFNVLQNDQNGSHPPCEAGEH
jgi:hypothetical protein